VDVEQLTPAPVAQLSGPLGRAHDVSEQRRGQHPGWLDAAAHPGEEPLDVVQDEVRRLPEQRLLGPGQLDESGILEVGAKELLDRPGAGDGTLVPGEPAPEALVAGAAGGGHGGHGLGPPELVKLGQEHLGDLRADPDRIVVGGPELGGGTGQDRHPGAFGSGPGEEQGHRAGVEPGQQRGLLGADLVQDAVKSWA
jgi:hypothetical protein